jgi:RNA polymerase sigma-70 factor (ECF subfamily)
VARRICSDAALAEEVIEDAYMQVWNNAARYDAGRGVVLAWLLMMVRSRALDALRRADEALVTDDPLALADEPADGSDPLDLLAALRRESSARAALAALPARDRQLLGLAFLRGLTHAEIAEATRLPLGSVKTAIRRALLALREPLRQYAPQTDLGSDDDDPQ